jgi:hypothetical protein
MLPPIFFDSALVCKGGVVVGPEEIKGIAVRLRGVFFFS